MWTYMRLLDEGTEVSRPVPVEEVGDGIYRVMPTGTYDPDCERWEFKPGSLVRCTVVSGEQVSIVRGPD